MGARARRAALVITCEHGGNRVPSDYAHLFAAHRAVLNSHRGWDPGSLDMGRAFAKCFNAPLIASTATRLLVELNRSPHHRALFSAITRNLPETDRRQIIDRWYTPHRRRVVERIERELARAEIVLHLAMHTFTPVLDGSPRRTDVGLLFDPSRRLERTFCRNWQAHLREGLPHLTIHRNQPYRGVSDGLGTALRRKWPATRFAVVELEVNQRFVTGPTRDWKSLLDSLTQTCNQALSSSALRAVPARSSR